MIDRTTRRTNSSRTFQTPSSSSSSSSSFIPLFPHSSSSFDSTHPPRASCRLTRNRLNQWFILLSLSILCLSTLSSSSSEPNIDWSSLGNVALIGSYSGLKLYNRSQTITSASFSSPSLSTNVSTLLSLENRPGSDSKSNQTSVQVLAQTSANGLINRICHSITSNVIYVAGRFDSLNSVPNTRNIARLDLTSKSVFPLANGLDGLVNDIDCTHEDRILVVGKFSNPSSSSAPTNVAIWNAWTSNWVPFDRQPRLDSAFLSQLHLLTSPSGDSLIVAGSFSLRLQSLNSTIGLPPPTNLSQSPLPLSQSNNSFALGSSLAPVSIFKSSSWSASPPSSDPALSSPQRVLCASAGSSQGNSGWQMDEAFQSGLFTLNLGRSVEASGVRLGNFYAKGGGTAGFHVVSLPDNQILEFSFLNPVTNRLDRCQSNCTLSRDLKIDYQDFVLSKPVSLSGIQLVITSKYGRAAGLNLLQVLSSGNTAYAVGGEAEDSDFSPVCKPAIGSNSIQSTGSWKIGSANSGIPGIMQPVKTATAQPGTTPESGPSLTWSLWVPQTGQYEIWYRSPGCSSMGDCLTRSDVAISVNPPSGLSSNSVTFNARNANNQATLIYNGTLLANDQVPVTLRLANTVSGSGPVTLVADEVSLRSLQVEQLLNMTSSGPTVSGIYEYVLSSTGAFGDGSLGNESPASSSPITAVDRMGIGLRPDSVVTAVTSDNRIVFAASQISSSLSLVTATTVTPPKQGLNGIVRTLIALDGTLYAGGDFTSTADGAVTGLNGLVKWKYGTPNSAWERIGSSPTSGVGLPVHAFQLMDSHLYIIGTSDSEGRRAIGAYDYKSSSWLSPNRGLYLGSLTAIGTLTNKPDKFYLAGNLAAIGDLEAPSGALLSTPSGKSGLPNIRGLNFEINQKASQAEAVNQTVAPRIKRSLDPWRTSLELRDLERGGYRLKSTKNKTPSKRQVQLSGLENLNASLPYPSTETQQGTILTGAFWKNDFILLGGRFVTTDAVKNVGIYDLKSSNLKALNGSRDLEGEVLAIAVVGDMAWIGGQFVSPSGRLGLDIYSLDIGTWASRTMAGLGPYPGTNVSVRAIKSRNNGDVIVAGSFQQLGSLPCQSVCLWSSGSNQWTSLGNGLRGVVNQVELLGSNLEELVVVGRFQLNSTVGDVSIARWGFDDQQKSWVGIGDQSTIPGPVRSVAVGGKGDLEVDGVFIGGDLESGRGSFLMSWDGSKWLSVRGLLSDSKISAVQFVPIRDPSTSVNILNGVKSDRMLMVSGLVGLENYDGIRFGSVLYDGTNWYPYILSVDSTGKNGIISRAISMAGGFRSAVRRIHTVAQVILISMAISLGIIFLGVLIGILIRLRKRLAEKKKGLYSGGAMTTEGMIERSTGTDDDDDGDGGEVMMMERGSKVMKTRRPTSLLATIDAATAGMVHMKEQETQQNEKGGNVLEDEKAINNLTIADERDEGYYQSGVDGLNDEEYVEVQGHDEVDDFDNGMGQIDIRRARWSFDPQLPGEIAVGAGESVEVKDRSNQEWWLVKRADGVEGVVPADWFL
ncbi:cortical protein marker for cell polarity-domain-containing protein [Phakopsora pachyrhizi]|nr:cortical protein marker for cell polarity-domain-containing protein [Phakopsora pachyrhizi]